mgnify:CR=1 FL=1
MLKEPGMKLLQLMLFLLLMGQVCAAQAETPGTDCGNDSLQVYMQWWEKQRAQEAAEFNARVVAFNEALGVWSEKMIGCSERQLGETVRLLQKQHVNNFFESMTMDEREMLQKTLNDHLANSDDGHGGSWLNFCGKEYPMPKAP